MAGRDDVRQAGGLRRVEVGVLLSVLICACLVAVAVIRGLSYSRTGSAGAWVRRSFLAGLAYQPESPANVRFFKILATPSMVAVQYFVFRALNRGHRGAAVGSADGAHRTLDFRSPWLRLLLTSLVSAQWVAIEWAKFTVEGFYPYSPLEDPWTNALTLLGSQALAFWGMKYLSFGPLFRS